MNNIIHDYLKGPSCGISDIFDKDISLARLDVVESGLFISWI
jgi:hypothetical protein